MMQVTAAAGQVSFGPAMFDAARILDLRLPRVLQFGPGCAARCFDAADATALARVMILTSPQTAALCEPLVASVTGRAGKATVWAGVSKEPTTTMLNAALAAARDVRPTCVVGLGGGSVLDLAKLVAALHDGDQRVEDVFGIGLVNGRRIPLILLPTTAGTGSEASPNAIALDERDCLKKGVISPHLVPDAAFVDPNLTLSVPPEITAATGLDALTHCIEAYANRLAHPLTDAFALEGVRLIGRSLRRAVRNGADLAARSDLALASLLGGMCLGPVNTGAVHALAYPLGGEFGLPHGLSNAILLPYVIEFNLDEAPQRYADIAVALGAGRQPDSRTTGQEGVRLLHELVSACGVDRGLSAWGVPASAVDRMAESAMTITRLLDRNVRRVSVEDAKMIYRRAM
jgi:alcohol dehydrogenase